MTPKRRRPGMFAKLSIAFMTASLLISGGVLAITIQSSMNTLTEQKSQDMSLYIERTGQFLDLYLQHLRNLLLSVSQSVGDPQVGADLEKLRLQLRDQAMIHNEYISHWFVIFDRGETVSSNQVLYEIIHHPRLQDMVRIAKGNPGLTVWSQPYYSPLQVGQTVAFALYVQPTRQQDGFVVIAEVQLEKLNRQLSELLNRQYQSLVLLSDLGEVIEFNGENATVPVMTQSLPVRMEEQFRRMLMELPNGVSRTRLADNKGTLLSVKSNRNKLGWYVIALSDDQLFRQSITELKTRLITFGAVSLLLLLLAALAISRHFMNPISRLARQMDRIDSERLKMFQQRPSERHDEIGQLTGSFHRMMTRIQDLMQAVQETEGRKKSLEVKLLLSQIRPHFLYNTLTCIGSLAKQGRVAELEDTIRSLIEVLSFSIDKKNDVVLLEEELQILQAYMQIQKVRYGDVFEYRDDVESGHKKFRLPKLLLQPLVENALFHGVVPNGEGTIRIRSRLEDGVLLLFVEDDGAGFPAGLDPQGRTPPRSKNGLNSIGLANVRDRIELNYGPDYGLDIGSSPGEGATIVIRLPASLE